MKLRTRKKMMAAVLDKKTIDRKEFDRILHNNVAADTALRATYRWVVGMRKHGVTAKISLKK